MAQVPYQPYPTAQPDSRGTPGISVNTPGAAFGENIGSALSHLGQVSEKAGDEIFARAVAMQQLTNETDAKNADIAFMGKAGDLHANYSSLQGEDRVKAFPQYKADLDKAYQETRGGLKNPMAQRMFDSAAVSTMSRSIFNAAGAAAVAQKQGALTAANAQDELLLKGAYNNPRDQVSIDAAAAQMRANAVNKAPLMEGGTSPERVDLLAKSAISKLYYHQIIGLASTNPKEAYDKLEEYKAKGLIFGQDGETAENKVRAFTHTVGMGVIADQVLTKYKQDDGTYSKSAAEMQSEAKVRAQELYPKDPAIGQAAATAIDRQFNQNSWAKTQDDRVVMGQLNGFITKGVTDVGQLPPDLRARMTDKQIREFPAWANTYRHSLDVQTDRAVSDRLQGLYQNDNAKFMDVNVMAEPGLSRSSINHFTKLQRETRSQEDPRVRRAMSWVRGSDGATLQALGVYNRTKDNTDDYDRFTGAMHEAIQAYQETYGKSPGEKEVTKEIFPSVIREIKGGQYNAFWWNTNSPFFKMSVPDSAKAEAEADAGKPLTDDQVRQHFNRKQFNEFYAVSKAAKPKAQDRVP